MTSFNGLLPPCEKCGHRNPIGFGLEKQIREEEEAKYLKKEKKRLITRIWYKHSSSSNLLYAQQIT